MIIDAHVTLGRIDSAESEVDELLELMDMAGVDMAIVSPDPRELAIAHREGHRRLTALRHRYPDRLRTYATANPWRGRQAVADISTQLDEGATAIKLHPQLQGFQPIDPLVAPILELAAGRGVPVYVHSGSPAASTPFQIAVMASRHPETRIILGRSGKTDFKVDAPAAFRQQPNLFADTAHDFPQTGMAAMLRAAGPGRVIFSSDYPYGSLSEELRKVKDLETDPETTARILGLNVLSILPPGACTPAISVEEA